MAGSPSFLAFANDVTFAQNKHHISLFNPLNSKYALKLHRLIAYNLQLANVTGVAVRMEVQWITGLSGGTAITPLAYNQSRQVELDSGIVCASGGTTTGGTLLYALAVNNDEVPTATADSGASRFDIFTAQEDFEHALLRPGQGISIKQITASVVGSFGWQLVFEQVEL